MAMTPAQRHKARALAEARDAERKNARLGIKPKKATKKGKRR